MMTIEERGLTRAVQYGMKHYGAGTGDEWKIYEVGYIDGANEQKAIDIDNALNWIITTYLGDYIDAEGYVDNVRLAEDLRKAKME